MSLVPVQGRWLSRCAPPAAAWAALALGWCLLAAGCSDLSSPEAAPERPPADAYPPEADQGLRADRWRTDHYEIRVVAGRDTTPDETRRLAREVGHWMEDALGRYEDLAGIPADNRAMPVMVYLSRKAYDEQAVRYGFPRRITSGLTSYDGVVHAYYRASGGLGPAATLMHEGFHQYTHRALYYPTPREVYAVFPGYKRPNLPTVPLWLEEGLGTVFETAVLDEESGPHGAPVRIDGYNAPRLKQLQEMIRRDRCPTVRQVMLLKLGDPLTADTYAAMWGLAYDLLRGGEMRSFPLGDFLRLSGNLWGVPAGEALAQSMRSAPTERQFNANWNRLMAEQCLARFEATLAANGYTLATWEQGWRERIMLVR